MTGIPRIVVGDPDKPGTWDELHPGDGARASGILIIPPAVLPGHSRPETRQVILDRILDNLANHYDIPPDARMPIILNPVPEGEPVTTPDPFGRDGGNIDEATARLLGLLSTVEGLSRYVDQLRDRIEEHAARRARDNDRHIRQMTELGQQLNEFRHIIEANKVGDLARRVTMLETTAGKYNTLDDDYTASSNPFEMLEAYRQGQRDAYRAAAAMARNTPTDDFSATLNHLAEDPA